MTGNPLLRRSVASPDEQIASDLLDEAAVTVTKLHHLGAVVFRGKSTVVS